MSGLKDAALDYAARGFRVIPCEPKGKKPLIPWREFQNVQATPEQISKWWNDEPDANVALVLGGGIFALDVDSPEGHAALRGAGIAFSGSTPTSLTGRGVHYFFRGEQADRVGLLPHVDIRGRGIVIAPPSIHASGKRYTWLQGLDTIQEAPPALLSLLSRPTPAQTPPDGASWLTEALAGVGEGRRDATCTRLAGYFLGKGMPKEAVIQTLQGWASRCTPPFPYNQVTKCVNSVAQKEGPHRDEVTTPEEVGSFVPMVIDSFTHPVVGKLSTSLGWLDDMLDGGIESEDYILLGARPGIGKTALALQCARTVASKGMGVLIVSREMGQRALTRRLLCQESQVPLHILKRGMMSEEQSEAIAGAGKRLTQMPLWISTARTIEDLEEHVKSYEPGAVRLVILDYLQLLRTEKGGGDTRHVVDHMSQSLRAIANRYAPVLCLSSLRRPPTDVKDYQPGMGDLKESGELEHDADIIWLLTREPGASLCKIILSKNRDGRVGSHYIRFAGDVLTFDENMEKITA